MQIDTPSRKLAPVVVFAYNRPDHLQKTLDALAANWLAADSHLFIFTDGPKPTVDKVSMEAIYKVRAIADEEIRFKTVTVHHSDSNLGLASSVIKGVTEIVNEYGKIIVLEDDLVTSPTFLNFMNEALDLYEQEEKVACISGYIYPVKHTLPASFFLRGADCWGWATWKRGWDLFEANGDLLLKQLTDKNLLNDFNFDNSFPYSNMLEDQIAGKNSSWAIRWYASAYLEEKLTLYPANSFVQNIGFDGTGTHSGKRNLWQGDSLTQEFKLEPIATIENKDAKHAVAAYFREIRKRNLGRRVQHAIKTLMNRFR